MPPRKRHKVAEEHRDPIARFSESLVRAEERERTERARAKQERKAADLAARLAAEHAERLRVANVELSAAIAAAKAAHASGKGIAEADARWRVAKARVIELETGAPPAWSGHRDDGPPQDQHDK
jgi:hypothetical protein